MSKYITLINLPCKNRFGHGVDKEGETAADLNDFSTCTIPAKVVHSFPLCGFPLRAKLLYFSIHFLATTSPSVSSIFYLIRALKTTLADAMFSTVRHTCNVRGAVGRLLLRKRPQMAATTCHRSMHGNRSTMDTTNENERRGSSGSGNTNSVKSSSFRQQSVLNSLMASKEARHTGDLTIAQKGKMDMRAHFSEHGILCSDQVTYR